MAHNSHLFGFSPKTLAVFGGKSLVSTLSGEFPEILRRLENREGVKKMNETTMQQALAYIQKKREMEAARKRGKGCLIEVAAVAAIFTILFAVYYSWYAETEERCQGGTVFFDGVGIPRCIPAPTAAPQK